MYSKSGGRLSSLPTYVYYVTFDWFLILVTIMFRWFNANHFVVPGFYRQMAVEERRTVKVLYRAYEFFFSYVTRTR